MTLKEPNSGLFNLSHAHNSIEQRGGSKGKAVATDTS